MHSVLSLSLLLSIVSEDHLLSFYETATLDSYEESGYYELSNGGRHEMTALTKMIKECTEVFHPVQKERDGNSRGKEWSCYSKKKRCDCMVQVRPVLSSRYKSMSGGVGGVGLALPNSDTVAILSTNKKNSQDPQLKPVTCFERAIPTMFSHFERAIPRAHSPISVLLGLAHRECDTDTVSRSTRVIPQAHPPPSVSR